MNAVRQLRRAGFTAFIASILALNCGEQEFNLLPLERENARGGSTTGGEGLVPPPTETGGASSGGRANAGGRGPTGGAAGRGGMSQGPQPCVAPDCCTKHQDCPDRRPYCLLDYVCHECYVDEDRSTVGCSENQLCGWGYICYLSCSTEQCPAPLKCDPASTLCVECVTNEDCKDEKRDFCNQFNTCV